MYNNNSDIMLNIFFLIMISLYGIWIFIIDKDYNELVLLGFVGALLLYGGDIVYILLKNSIQERKSETMEVKPKDAQDDWSGLKPKIIDKPFDK